MDKPKDEAKPAKAEKPAPEEKPAPKKEAKPEPVRKVETKPRDVFSSGRQDRVVYTHNRKSGQR